MVPGQPPQGSLAMFRRLLSLALAAAALTASAIHGQCIGPDNLNGPCCTQVGANLPNFPAITLPGLGICWSSCTPTTNCTNVTLAMPIQTSCGQFSLPMNVSD